MQTISYIILAFLVGVIISIYLPMNSSVSRYLGSPITANISFFMVAFIASIFIFAFFGDYKTVFNIKKVPPYLYLTGLGAALMVLGTTFLIPKIGARKFFLLVMAGQILMAMIISHFGVLESPKDPITFKKIIGVILVVMGAVISLK
ncbi:MAG: DMT family transporter [bacterium]